MLELPQKPPHALPAAVDALTMQLLARVPLYQNAAGTVLVPLHPLLDTAELDLILEATALTLHGFLIKILPASATPQTCWGSQRSLRALPENSSR